MHDLNLQQIDSAQQLYPILLALLEKTLIESSSLHMKSMIEFSKVSRLMASIFQLDQSFTQNAWPYPWKTISETTARYHKTE